jgi:dTDP-4-amino-4,6-dideoxygalactose transaminase
MSLPDRRQSIGAAEVAAVAHAVGDALLTGGPTLARFEARLAETVGVQYAIAVSSGTAALHVAYLAAGVGPGSRVLTAPLTFVATANAAVYCGATVAFADVDERGSLDPLAVANAEPAPFVVPVHYAGHPAQLEGIAEAAPSAIVIEDACHALGAMYRDRAGTWRRVGDCAHSAMAVFSFHAVKTITTGEGGAIVTNDALLASRCRRLRDHGLERELEGPADPWAY